MESKLFSIDEFNIKHKDGYYLVSGFKVSEKGNEYSACDKTFSNQLAAQNYLKSRGVDNNDAAACLLDALFDYQQKTSQTHTAQVEKAKLKKLNSENTK